MARKAEDMKLAQRVGTIRFFMKSHQAHRARSEDTTRAGSARKGGRPSKDHATADRPIVRPTGMNGISTVASFAAGRCGPTKCRAIAMTVMIATAGSSGIV